jgi:hypothetical protein
MRRRSARRACWPPTFLALWVLIDLVQAAVRTGRHSEAAAHVTAMRDAGIAAISPPG